MKTITISVPTKNPANGKLGREDVMAECHGPLCIHIGFGTNVGFHVIAHIVTGYSVLRSPSKTRARIAIRKLLRLPVDWSFTDPNAVKGWPKDVLRDIKHINAEMME